MAPTGRPTTTYVTSLFDIGRRSEGLGGPLDSYVDWLGQLLALPIDLVCFTTPDIAERLAPVRRANLRVELLDGTGALPCFDQIEEVRGAWRRHRTNDPAKDTPEFACLTHAKFPLLRRAIAANPHRSSHFGWIDAGIAKVATELERLPTLVPRDRVRLLQIRYTAAAEIARPDFVDECRYKVAGGFFTGRADLLDDFARVVEALAQRDLQGGRFGLEQEYMAIAYRTDPVAFDPYYGDFCDLVASYDRCRGSVPLVSALLADAIAAGDHLEAERVRSFLRSSE